MIGIIIFYALCFVWVMTLREIAELRIWWMFYLFLIFPPLGVMVGIAYWAQRDWGDI